MKEIDVGKGYKAIIDDEDFERVNERIWTLSNTYTGRCHFNQFIVSSQIKSYGSIHLQKFILNSPRGKFISFKNGDTLNFRKSNLTIFDNHKDISHHNRKNPNQSSRYLGVCWMKNRKVWIAYAYDSSKQFVLGFFSNEETAAKVRDDYVRKNYSGVISTNFPKEGELSALSRINDELLITNRHSSRRSKNGAGYKGSTAKILSNGKTRYKSQITRKSKCYYLGMFDTALEAHESHEAAKIKYAEFGRPI